MKTCEYGVYNPTIDEVEPCGNLVEGNTDMCASHNAFFRKLEKQNIKSAEKRKQLLSKPKKIYAKPNKISDKQKSLNETYKEIADEFKRTNPSCLARVNQYCTGKTESVHHKRGRGRYLLDVSTFLPCCLSCHGYIEAHPKEAIERGWSESRLAKTEPHKI